MPHNCCVKYCKNNTQKGYRLFRIPSSAERHQTWLQLLNQPQLHKEARICECHFSEDQFESKRLDGKKLLKPFAIPDLLSSIDVENTRKSVENDVPMSSTYSEITEMQTAQSTERSENDMSLESTQETSNSSINNSIEKDALGNESNEDELNDQLETLLENSEDVLNSLKQTIKSLSRKCRRYEKKLQHRENTILESIFNEDQLQFLETDKRKGTKWSDDTITKGLKLYLACGTEGYTELLRQKLPYPSIRTLQHRIRNLKFIPGILEDVLQILKLRVSITVNLSLKVI
ncbi:hypothetical protein ABEB36_011290 [Hypothenemus hampei]|uniref:THAP-type domain-containing protein n=1 Tax=Hypothenemus hampei TaxID=57062 RepID=A0ABD1EFI7_HYPHA